MLNKATTLIIIVLLIISACEKTEDSKAPDNSFVVFSSDGIEKSTKDKGFIFLSGKDTNIKLEHFDRKGKKLWRCDLGNYLTQYPKYKILNFCETNEGGIVGLSNYSDTMYDVSYLKMFKIDSRGKFLWERTVALDVHWVPEYTGLINDGKDNYISSFFTWSTGLSSGFIKIDSTGRLLYYQNSNLITVSIMNISDDHLFAVANDYDFSNGTFVYKFDSSANRLFQTPVLPNFQQRNIISTSDGGCLVSGQTNSESNTFDFYIQKFGPSGNLEFLKKFGSIYNDFLSTVLETRDGGLLLVGRSSANALNGNNFTEPPLDFNSKTFVVKLDASYNLQWSKSIDGDFGSQGVDATEDESGPFYILCKKISHGNDALVQMCILSLSSDGNFK